MRAATENSMEGPFPLEKTAAVSRRRTSSATAGCESTWLWTALRSVGGENSVPVRRWIRRASQSTSRGRSSCSDRIWEQTRRASSHSSITARPTSLLFTSSRRTSTLTSAFFCTSTWWDPGLGRRTCCSSVTDDANSWKVWMESQRSEYAPRRFSSASMSASATAVEAPAPKKLSTRSKCCIAPASSSSLCACLSRDSCATWTDDVRSVCGGGAVLRSLM
mmetsp:Transcript_24608/g.58587  ORF Transcript_24608/g.58587 Transcript_24608/m.58587 type:complete len:220 (+) Transcript_24608:158-817(+)